ncbi:hypothetical protein CBR_g41037 [Chara braunii]|uniref:Uncharacterized protein n=1 Tax=Chara braunii TaxID=69332 RepID=A0A388LV70_CHABU|nr:hypothetical protein CBR_g41037 [Chara braunii]|eukprot:GBG86133.1 hypothetical protein CBR_g41037 [Chara braunii]
MNETWNAKFEAMWGAMKTGPNVGANVDEIDKLKKQIESLQIKNSQWSTRGPSTSRSTGGDDAFLARLVQEQEVMKQKMESAFRACGKMENMEEEIRNLKKSREDALAEAENWKKEALRTGNLEQLRQLHNMEVEALKGLQQRELNWRREAEQENARLKEELAKHKEEAPKSTFREKLEEAGERDVSTAKRTSKGRKNADKEEDSDQESKRAKFISDAKKDMRGKKKDAMVEIWSKEGIKYTTLNDTIGEIIAKRVERAFGKRPAIQEVSDDVAGEPLEEQAEARRDSATS